MRNVLTINFSHLLARACVYCRGISLQFFFPSRLVLSQISAFCIFCLRAYPCSIHFLIFSLPLSFLFFLFNSSGSYPYLHSFTFSSFPSLFAYFYIPLYYNRFYYVIYIQWNGGSMNIHLESIVVNSLDWLNERIKWSEESAQFMCLTFTRKQSNSSCFSRGT